MNGRPEVRRRQGIRLISYAGLVDPRYIQNYILQVVVAREARHHPGAAEAVLLARAHAAASSTGPPSSTRRLGRRDATKVAKKLRVKPPRSARWSCGWRGRPVPRRADGRGRRQLDVDFVASEDRAGRRALDRQERTVCPARFGAALAASTARALHRRAAGHGGAPDDAEGARRALRLLGERAGSSRSAPKTSCARSSTRSPSRSTGHRRRARSRSRRGVALRHPVLLQPVRSVSRDTRGAARLRLGCRSRAPSLGDELLSRRRRARARPRFTGGRASPALRRRPRLRARA